MTAREDPLTGYTPSRVLLSEDEERDAEAGALTFEDPPHITWSLPELSGGRERGRLKVNLLVLLTSPTGSALFKHCGFLGQARRTYCHSTHRETCSICELVQYTWQNSLTTGSENSSSLSRRVTKTVTMQQIARITLPASSLKGPKEPSRKAGNCVLYSPDDCSPQSEFGLVVGACYSKIPPERAFAWAKGLLDELQPGFTIVESSIPLAEFRGGFEDSDAPQHYGLCTTAAARKAAADILPKFPTGNLVSGAPAAVLSRLQAAGDEALLVTSVQPLLKPGLVALRSLAQTLKALLVAAGYPSDRIATLNEKANLLAAAEDLSQEWKRSPQAALYI